MPASRRPVEVTLREITSETVRKVTALAVAPEQEGYVASNAVSIAEAYFEPKAWFRTIAAGEELVGFVMVHRDPDARVFYVWRFMIDARHQGRGFGRRAMELVLAEARSDGAPAVTLSVVPGERSALDFYRRLGFEETGAVHGGEVVMRLELGSTDDERPA
ncbi:MAG TPA: GNAT family N-acetyltransferase [Gaiellaceae bacterium]|nr:GNAT family N-acetyltransferase [Gaiellaceae bacterium]